MLITIDVYEIKDGTDKVCAARVAAQVMSSAGAGYDAATLAKLEDELEELVNRRLAEALNVTRCQ